MSNTDSLEVTKYLPHRYPFLLVDKVLSLTPFQSIVAIKNVTHNESFFSGHFPEHPVMPGVLIVEALAQASGILMNRSFELNGKERELHYLAGIDDARFKRKVVPGDQLTLTVEVIRHRENLWKFKGEANVDGELACVASFMNIKA